MPSPSPIHTDTQPRWCCAILTDARGHLLLERRPPTDPDAPGLLTCFGGTREHGESPLACLQRELLEEIGHQLADEPRHAVTLHTGKGIAWFFAAAAPAEGTVTALEAGHTAVWHDPALGLAGIALWNRLAIEAFLANRSEAVAP